MMIGKTPIYSQFDIERLAQPPGQADAKHAQGESVSRPKAGLSGLGSKLLAHLREPSDTRKIAGMKAFLDNALRQTGRQMDQKTIDTRLAHKTVQQAAAETLQIVAESRRATRLATVINDMKSEFPEDRQAMSDEAWQAAVQAAETALGSLLASNPRALPADCTFTARQAFIAQRDAMVAGSQSASQTPTGTPPDHGSLNMLS